MGFLASLPPRELFRWSYVINLDRRPDRWRKVTEELSKVGIVPRRIPAVDGIHLGKIEQWNGITRRRWFWPGYVACTRSHRKAIQWALREGLPYVAVFEDDVVLKPDFYDLISVPQGTRLLLLGSRPCQRAEKKWQGFTPCWRAAMLYVACRSVFGELLTAWSDETIENDAAWNRVKGGVYLHSSVLGCKEPEYSDLMHKVTSE